MVQVDQRSLFFHPHLWKESRIIYFYFFENVANRERSHFKDFFLLKTLNNDYKIIGKDEKKHIYIYMELYLPIHIYIHIN